MISVSNMINMNILACNYCQIKNTAEILNNDFDECSLNVREIVTTWKFDEEGNIVYYTMDKKTGEVLSKTKYKNPNKIF